GGTLAGGPPFAGGPCRPQPLRHRGAGGELRKGSSRTPTPTAGGKRAVRHVIYCEIITRPGGGRQRPQRRDVGDAVPYGAGATPGGGGTPSTLCRRLVLWSGPCLRGSRP